MKTGDKNTYTIQSKANNLLKELGQSFQQHEMKSKI